MNYEDLLKNLNTTDIYGRMIEFGYNSNDIKDMVVDILSIHFDNKDIVEQLAIKTLLPEVINILRLEQNAKYFQIFEQCIKTLKHSKTVNSLECYNAVAQWTQDINRAISNYLSYYFLEHNKINLQLEEFSNECFKNIGEIIEGSIKPFLYHLLNHCYIVKNKIVTTNDFNNKDLGNVIDELINSSGYSMLFQLEVISGNISKQIKLNQWRNIAAHKNYYVENNKIICEIKRKNVVIDSFTIEKDELFNVLKNVNSIFNVLKLSYTIFFIDNIHEINKFNPEVRIRKEAKLINFIMGIQSQGFRLLDFQETTKESKIIVQDISSMENIIERMVHSSQFLFNEWRITGSEIVSVEYVDSNGNHRMLFKISSDICESIYNGKLPRKAQAEKMDIIKLESNNL